MRRNYDEEMLRQINENADLLGYVSQTMELEQRNGEFWAHCPFHTDLTPSLSFSPDKNLYYCFSCGVGGGIVKYLMDFEGLDFEDAVEKAARLADMDLSKMCQSETVSFLRKVKNCGCRREPYKHPVLRVSELDKYTVGQVWEWLEEGITQDAMDLFGVRIDEWSNRIIYPVYDIDGNLINIKGRTRHKNYKKMRIPKYINYNEVGVMDYFQGLNFTLGDVLKSGEIIIFESIKSVMKAYSWGYRNCASAEKHTLTDEQIELLVKLRVNVVLAYDCDVEYFREPAVKDNINKLKRMTNVYVVNDPKRMLGGAETKNAPVDCGKDIWDTLYATRKKVT